MKIATLWLLEAFMATKMELTVWYSQKACWCHRYPPAAATAASAYSVPHGLEYSDDKDILIDVDSDEEALRSLFPRDKSRKNMVPGGPEKARCFIVHWIQRKSIIATLCKG